MNNTQVKCCGTCSRLMLNNGEVKYSTFYCGLNKDKCVSTEIFNSPCNEYVEYYGNSEEFILQCLDY